jgi:ribonuclease D
VDAVLRGLERDPADLPPIEREKGTGAGNAATVELLKVLLRMISERNGVASKIIANSDDLDRISADDAADVPALHGWRRELFGEQALRLKSGRLALAVERGRVITIEREPGPPPPERRRRASKLGEAAAGEVGAP